MAPPHREISIYFTTTAASASIERITFSTDDWYRFKRAHVSSDEGSFTITVSAGDVANTEVDLVSDLAVFDYNGEQQARLSYSYASWNLHISADGSLFGTTATLSMLEGASRNLFVRLDTKPPSDVTVALTLTPLVAVDLGATVGLSGGALIQTSSSQLLSFSSVNWYEAQTVVLTAFEDVNLSNGTIVFDLFVIDEASSAYELTSASLTIEVVDDDLLTIVLATATISASAIILEGTSASFTVHLSAQPDADVSVDVAIQLDGYVSAVLVDSAGMAVSQLRFSTVNWQLGQTLTIESLADDDSIDGRITFIATASSAVYGFGDAATETFTLWLEDDDEADITLTLLSATTIYENGEQIVGGVGVRNMATHSVIVSLTAQPLFDVEIVLDSPMLTGMANRQFTDLAGSPINRLNFSSANWHIGQTVLFGALSDDDVWGWRCQ